MLGDFKVADLRQYPPERCTGLSGEEHSCYYCDKDARWVLLAFLEGGGSTAVCVCAQHLGEEWNRQGRPR